MAVNKVNYRGNTLIDISDTTANSDNVDTGEVFYDNTGTRSIGNRTTTEVDPIFSSSVASEITSTDITNWNNKSDFSGSYNDLSNKPSIPTKTSQLTNDSGFTTFSGSYNDLSNKPTIPTKTSQLTNDSGYTTFSGDYNDLTNKPTIPTVPTNVSAFTNDAGYTTNTGTITSVKMNGTTVSSSGEADLGTVITQHQDISGKQDTLVSGTNIKTINNNSLLGSGDITIQGGTDLSDILWSSYKEYSTTKTYKEGDLVVYDNKLYYCNDNNVSGTWNSDKWVQTSIVDLYGNMNSVSDLTGDLPATYSSSVSYLNNVKEEVGNKVVSISSASTDNQYPSAKCVYDIVGDIESLLGGI